MISWARASRTTKEGLSAGCEGGDKILFGKYSGTRSSSTSGVPDHREEEVLGIVKK